MKVLEAGGYQETDEQLKQIEQCIKWQAQAILVGSVNFEKLNKKHLSPTDTAFTVTDFLEEYFKKMMEYKFTKDVESDFDKIAE